jgi:hypothetical protein
MGHSPSILPYAKESEIQGRERVYGPCDVGAAIAFSGAQLHGTPRVATDSVRFSLDFRTIEIADVEAGIGAPNIDNESLGSNISNLPFLKMPV